MFMSPSSVVYASPVRLALQVRSAKSISLLRWRIRHYMIKKTFSRTTISLCACAMFYAAVGSAQSCPATVNGFYSYTAIGNGVPSALIATGTTTGTGTGTTTTTLPFSTTGVGQLVSGTTGSVPFASSGKLYFD